MVIRTPAHTLQITQRAAYYTYTWTHNICFRSQVSQPHVLFIPLSSLVWQIYNELWRTPWQMLVLCHDPKQPQTTAGDWPSILLYLLARERERGGPEETSCSIRLMLMRPSASAVIHCCPTCYWHHFSLYTLLCFNFIELPKVCWEMAEMRRGLEEGWA